MPIGDTIVALASPPGRSAASLLRISGPATRVAVGACCGIENGSWRRCAAAARFRLSCDVGAASSPTLDLPVLLMTFEGPRSYTAEDAAELLVPGNPHVVRRVIDALVGHDGVRHAGPGEFSARAYLAGKLTLEQAEGVAATIAARTNAELDAARALLSGRSGVTYTDIADRIATLLALTEAGIDFTDQEDVVAIAPSSLATGIEALEQRVTTLLGGPAAGEAGETLPRVVLAGQPNAGKSTLFNVLLGYERAVVSEVAGTTRDVISEPLPLDDLHVGGGQVLLCDLAGIDAGVGVSRLDDHGRSAARAAIAAAHVVIYCDPNGRFEGLSVPPSAHVIRVRTKGDLVGVLASTTPASSNQAICVCALDGWGVGALRRAIADGAWGAATAVGEAVLPRHRLALRRTLDALAASRDAIGDQATSRTLHNPESVAASLRTALDAMEQLAGRISPDDVLGRVFATFCIGK